MSRLAWLAWPPIPWPDRPAALRTRLRIGAAAWKPSPEPDVVTADRRFRDIGVPESLRKPTLDQLVIGLL
ncbi:hypothetical protein ACFZC5_06575 [Nocardia gamkensis]|uniref:hypothetical protein n=1 Tax=Nocardia gamkensis TaxID=352869 RepID=UPI0036EA86A5